MSLIYEAIINEFIFNKLNPCTSVKHITFSIFFISEKFSLVQFVTLNLLFLFIVVSVVIDLELKLKNSARIKYETTENDNNNGNVSKILKALIFH